MTEQYSAIVHQIAAAALLVFALASTAPADPVRIAGSYWVADAPTKVADQLGLFNRRSSGPLVRVEHYESGKEALETLLAGDAEFALAASTPIADALLTARSGNADAAPSPLMVLAAVSLSNRTHVVIADAAAGIERPADLAGRRIGVMLGTSGHYGWRQFAEFNGIDQSAVTLVDLPVGFHADEIVAGRIDASAIWEPWASQLEAKLGKRARNFTTRHLYTVSWLLVTRPEVLANHPGLAERVLAGYLQAVELIDTDPRRARQLHARAIDIEPEILAPLETGIIWGLGLDWAVLADMESQFRWLTESRGVPDRAVPPPYRYLHADPLRRVAPRRVTLPDYFFADGGVESAAGAGS